jgi:hypothetical protein
MEEKEAKVREIQKDNIIAKSKVRRPARPGLGVQRASSSLESGASTSPG